MSSASERLIKLNNISFSLEEYGDCFLLSSAFVHRVSEESAKLFLSELRQISINFNNFS